MEQCNYLSPISALLRLVFPTCSCPTSMSLERYSILVPVVAACRYASLAFTSLARISTGILSASVTVKTIHNSQLNIIWCVIKQNKSELKTLLSGNRNIQIEVLVSVQIGDPILHTINKVLFENFEQYYPVQILYDAIFIAQFERFYCILKMNCIHWCEVGLVFFVSKNKIDLGGPKIWVGRWRITKHFYLFFGLTIIKHTQW